MKGFLKKFMAKVAKGQGGFTLIEMIVVVGIIAVLAAVIVPNIGKFIGSGEQGAKDAEKESVQTAMNAMMAEKAVTKVNALVSPATSTADWASLPDEDSTDPGAVPWSSYLQSASTVYYYCYDGFGQIKRQDEAAAACPASY
jgi:type IV pilus assembly protein PilA